MLRVLPREIFSQIRQLGLFRQFLPCLNDFFRVLLVFWPKKYFPDESFFIDYKSGTMNSHILTTVQFLFSPNPVLINDCMLRIGYQGEWQIEFCFKLFMLFFIVRTNS